VMPKVLADSPEWPTTECVPVLAPVQKPVLEVHLLDVEAQGYGRPVEVRFIDFIRAEQTFETPEALKAQIALDVEKARATLASRY
jgi:FAD synthase